MPEHLIVGGGVFGLTAAIELRERGHAVTLIDPGPIPHPLAASNDLNKVVRMEYGADARYLDMVDRAIDGWIRWNERFGAPVYMETGVLLLAADPVRAGGYEYESLQQTRRAGRAVERLGRADIARRFGGWNADAYAEALFNPRGGYTASGLTVRVLARCAAELGVDLREGVAATGLLDAGGRVAGVTTREHGELRADHTIVAAGVWTAGLVPELAPFLRTTAHPMFYLQPDDPTDWGPPRFCTFTADVSRTGWYGMPIDPATGLLKFAKHDAGHNADPDGNRGSVPPHRIAELRSFLRESLPALADAPLDRARHCFYTDTLDGHFWITRHPERASLTISTGGCGHAMKMAPVLGGLTADAVEGRPNLWLDRFRWRTDPSAVPGDAARMG